MNDDHFVMLCSYTELLVEHASPDDAALQKVILSKISDYCGKPVTNHTLDEFEPPYQWTFYHSVFFAFTVCSTLGKGIVNILLATRTK